MPERPPTGSKTRSRLPGQRAGADHRRRPGRRSRSACRRAHRCPASVPAAVKASAEEPDRTPAPASVALGEKAKAEVPERAPAPPKVAVGSKASVAVPSSRPPRLPVAAAVKARVVVPARIPGAETVPVGANASAAVPESSGAAPVIVAVGVKASAAVPASAPAPLSVAVGAKASAAVPAIGARPRIVAVGVNASAAVPAICAVRVPVAVGANASAATPASTPAAASVAVGVKATVAVPLSASIGTSVGVRPPTGYETFRSRTGRHAAAGNGAQPRGHPAGTCGAITSGGSSACTKAAGRIAYAHEPLALFDCVHVNAPVGPAVAISRLACAIEVSVPPVDCRCARSGRTPGNTHAWPETGKSGEFATTSTTHAPASIVVICACVTLAEAFCSPTIVAPANGSLPVSAPRYCVTIAAQLSVRPLPVIVCPV